MEKKEKMKLSSLIQGIESSKEFQKFKKENPSSYLCAGFFILDFESGKNTEQIDFFLPKKNKIATFNFDNPDKITIKIQECLNSKKMGKLGKIKIQPENIKEILEKEMKKKKIKSELIKIIAVIQNIEGKDTWILNCFLSGLKILKARINDKTGKIIKFDEANILDFVKTK